MDTVLHIQPFYYAHVLDQNTNITSLVEGPLTFSLAVNQKLVFGPAKCIIIPPGYYCIVKNPVKNITSKSSYVIAEGHKEVRFEQEPFSLYPGEILDASGVKKLPVIPFGWALNLLVLEEFVDDGKKHYAGEEIQIKGPATYKPRIELEEKNMVQQIVVKFGESLKLKAKLDLIDGKGVSRKTGDVWLMSALGPYLLQPYELLVETIRSQVITDDLALHIRCTISHKDQFGVGRRNGDEWLVTTEHANLYTPDVNEEVVGLVNRTVLKKGQFCIVLNPQNDQGKSEYGKKKLIHGPCDFFLKPGEVLESGVRENYILDAYEAVVLRSNQTFLDKSDPSNPNGIQRTPGESWMLNGPIEYVPPIEVSVIEKRKAMPLDENDGVYVRDTTTGKVRLELGPKSYMLKVNERLYEKELPPLHDELLKSGGGKGEDEDIRKVAYFSTYADPALLKGPRDKTRVVKYKIPPGTAAKINDHTSQTSRILFGPDLAVLGPYEDFNVLSLSAGKPKKAHALKSMVLFLGPDYITDVIKVETSDHAVLNIRLSYNNRFVWDSEDKESHEKIFSVPDFIGYACSIVGGRIREFVAQVTFDQFHKKSNSIIEEAVFFNKSTGKIEKELKLEANNLVIDNVDVHAIEPADAQVSSSLTKSVQMAIEIATKTIEIHAKNEALYEHQKAVGALEIQKLSDELQKEKTRYSLLEIISQNAAIESCGAAIAEAKARAESLLIEGTTAVKLASLQAQARKIEFESQLSLENKQRELELHYQKTVSELEIRKAQEKANLEVFRMESYVNTLTRQTIIAMAQAGPEMQAKLLGSLGVSSMLITDGNNPINLFNTAKAMITDVTDHD